MRGAKTSFPHVFLGLIACLNPVAIVIICSLGLATFPKKAIILAYKQVKSYSRRNNQVFYPLKFKKDWQKKNECYIT